MKLKYAFFAVICAAAVMLTGCGSKLTYKDGIADIKNANITVSIPEDWTVGVGEDAYNVIYDNVDLGEMSVKDLKAMYEEVGAQILLSARSSDGSVTVTFTQVEKGDRTAEELLQSQHDNAVFNLRSFGFFTESSIEEYEWGGISGYLSVISTFYEEGDPECVTEGRQFYFERGDHIFSLVIESLGGNTNDANSIVISSKE